MYASGTRTDLEKMLDQRNRPGRFPFNNPGDDQVIQLFCCRTRPATSATPDSCRINAYTPSGCFARALNSPSLFERDCFDSICQQTVKSTLRGAYEDEG